MSENNFFYLKIAKKTKTGNYNDNIKTCIGRYTCFCSYLTPTSLLQNNSPVLSNTLMLWIGLFIYIRSCYFYKTILSYVLNSVARESVFDRQR